MLKYKVFLVTSSSLHVVGYTSGGVFSLSVIFYIAHQMYYLP